MLLITNSKTYDFLKWLAQIFLPAFGALYFGLAEIWGFPKAAEVVGTITVIDAFLGVILQLSSNAYYKSDERFDGQLDAVKTVSDTSVTLNLEGDANEVLASNDELLLKVNNEEHSEVAVELVDVELEKKPKPRKRTPRKKV